MEIAAVERVPQLGCHDHGARRSDRSGHRARFSATGWDHSVEYRDQQRGRRARLRQGRRTPAPRQQGRADDDDLAPIAPALALIRKYGVRAGIDTPVPFDDACYASCRSPTHGLEELNGLSPVGSEEHRLVAGRTVAGDQAQRPEGRRTRQHPWIDHRARPRRGRLVERHVGKLEEGRFR